MQIRNVLVAATVAALAGAAHADFTFPAFNLAVPSVIQSIDLNGASVPAGVYQSYEASIDWVPGGGDPWSNEAIWALVDRAAPDNTGTFYADPGAAGNSQANGNPITLTWSGLLDAPYTGGNPLHFWTLQTFAGSNAQWNNIRLTLKSSGANPPAGAIDLGTLNSGMTMANGTLAAQQVIWYSFSVSDIAAAQNTFLTIDTFGSTLTGGSFGNGNDSEIGLYNANGQLIATNDDADFGAGNLLSFLGFGAGQTAPGGALAAGTYYLAIGGFDTTFGGGFNVTSTSPVNGNYKVTLNTNVPAPAAVALFGMAGLVGSRRRRA